MLPAIRFVRWTVLGSVLVAVVVSVVLAGRSPSSPQSFGALFGGGTEQTAWGPLGPSDRDLLLKVRQVNLWEGPTSELAAQQAVDPAVREVGRKLGVEHAQLDASLRTVADKLKLVLPSQPNDTQRVWMADIGGRTGEDFDHAYVNLLRSAHGEVMPLVEGVRAGTQNSLVRQYAIQVSEFVARHMDYLESTGHVDYSLLPPSTAPAARVAALGGYNVPITLILFVIAVAAAAALVRGLNRGRPAGGGPVQERLSTWLAGWQSDWRTKLAAAVQSGGPPGTGRLPGARLEPEPEPGDRRYDDQDAMVTTAELIAVLTPGSLDDPGRPRDPRPGGATPSPTAAGSPPIPVQRTASSGVRADAPRRPSDARPSDARPSDARPSDLRPLDRRPPKVRRNGGERRW